MSRTRGGILGSRRALAVFISLALLILLVWSAPGRAYAAQLRRYPYLTDITAGSVRVNWATNTSATTGSVTWGHVGTEPCTAHPVAAARRSISVNGVAEYQWTAFIGGLRSPRTYCYRIRLGSTDLLATDVSPQFRTILGPAANTAFSFAVFGDWGFLNSSGQNPDQAKLHTQIARSGASFAITTGDQPYGTGNDTDYGDLVYSLSSVFAPTFWTVPGRSIPIFPILGNHGLRVTYIYDFPQNSVVAASGGRYQSNTYCCLNGTTSTSYPSAWYAFTTANVRFYLLDASWANFNIGSTGNLYKDDFDYHWATNTPQYRWLKNDLAVHKSTPLKFAFFHFPLYSDNTEPSDTYLSGPTHIEGLLASYGVKIVFNGHAHIYERNIKQNGIISYITGGGGAALETVNSCRSFDAYAIGWSYSANAGTSCKAPKPTSTSQVFHFLLVQVSGRTVRVIPKDENGNAFDTQTYSF